MTTVSNSLAIAFIDLATYDITEQFMYGTDDARTYFVRQTVKSTWFSIVPVALSKGNGQANFNAEWSAKVTRSADYLLNVWLRVTLPSVSLSNAATSPYNASYLRWTNNVMHNLIRSASITFNELSVQQFDNTFLDMWAAFTVPASKRNGYANMIGAVSELTQPVLAGTALPSVTLNLPLPFFFTRDSGWAIPTAAITFNDIAVNLSFRDVTELLLINAPTTGSQAINLPSASFLTNTAPTLSASIWATYAMVSGEERARMGCQPRYMLIEQTYRSPAQQFTPGTNAAPSFDIRFSNAVKALFWAARNVTTPAEGSNYTSLSGLFISPAAGTNNSAVVTFPGGDPIISTALYYESSARLGDMGSDYYSLVSPWYYAPAIPDQTGFHMYSFALNFMSIDPTGSTNFSRLGYVSIQTTASAEAIAAASAVNGTNLPYQTNQRWELILWALVNTVVLINGGTLSVTV